MCVCVRGKMSLETVCLILAYKMKYPESIFMLRGNHESASINRYNGYIHIMLYTSHFYVAQNLWIL